MGQASAHVSLVLYFLQLFRSASPGQLSRLALGQSRPALSLRAQLSRHVGQCPIRSGQCQWGRQRTAGQCSGHQPGRARAHSARGGAAVHEDAAPAGQCLADAARDSAARDSRATASLWPAAGSPGTGFRATASAGDRGAPDDSAVDGGLRHAAVHGQCGQCGRPVHGTAVRGGAPAPHGRGHWLSRPA